MPTKYACSTCDLEFTLGSWHDHSFHTGYAGGAGAVCLACGAQHELEFAVEDRGPPEHAHYNVLLIEVPTSARLIVLARLREEQSLSLAEAKAALENLPHLLRTDLWAGEEEEYRAGFEQLGAATKLEEHHREPNADFGPIMQDKLHLIGGPSAGQVELPVVNRSPGPCGRFALEEQSCGACGKVATLATELSDPLPTCPRCGQARLTERGGWIT